MGIDDNKALARAGISIWSTGDFSRISDIFAPSYVMHQRHHADAAGDLDIKALEDFAREFRRGFPDFKDSIDLQLAEGDLVATRFTSNGTHTGTFQSIAPTGRKLSWSGIVIDRIAGGRITESWANWDMLGMLRQLGAIRP